MSDESTKKYTDAYNLFASIVRIEPKDYDVFQVSRDGDTLTIKPGCSIHPSTGKMLTCINMAGFWDEVALANLDAKEAKIAELKELINKFIAEALR